MIERIFAALGGEQPLGAGRREQPRPAGATRGRAVAAVLLALALVGPAGAQTPGPSPQPEHTPPQGGMTRPDMDERARRRFPQPVRVGTLIGRDLLEPDEAQPVLGRVEGLVRRADGSTEMVVRLAGRLALGGLGSGWLGWQGFVTRPVGVPVEAVALLGEHVALIDLTPDRLRALPTFALGSATEITPDETIRVGIVRPFH